MELYRTRTPFYYGYLSLVDEPVIWYALAFLLAYQITGSSTTYQLKAIKSVDAVLGKYANSLYYLSSCIS